MATYYALPGLTNWDTVSGYWSLTSGGANSGAVPSSADDVVFDANSGSPRTISLFNVPQCRDLTFSGNNALTFNAGATIVVYGHLTAASNVTFAGEVSAAGAGRTVCNIAGNGAHFKDLRVNNATSYISNLSGIICGGYLFLETQGTTNLSGNISARVIQFNNAGIVNMGSGVISVTDVNDTNTVFNAGYVTGLTLNGQTCTLKFTGSGTGDLFAYIDAQYGDHFAYATVWNDLTGGAVLIPSTFSCDTFRVSPGSTTKITGGQTIGANNWLLNGSGATTILQSTSTGTKSYVSKLNGGVVNAQGISLSDISAVQSNLFKAFYSVDNGTNVNWTFMKTNSNFASFF